MGYLDSSLSVSIGASTLKICDHLEEGVHGNIIPELNVCSSLGSLGLREVPDLYECQIDVGGRHDGRGAVGHGGAGGVNQGGGKEAVAEY